LAMSSTSARTSPPCSFGISSSSMGGTQAKPRIFEGIQRPKHPQNLNQ
jgi:hypothetical protein